MGNSQKMENKEGDVELSVGKRMLIVPTIIR